MTEPALQTESGTTEPPLLQAARPRVNALSSCYHEAGHCAAFWHFGIDIDYVTMRPPPASGHRGHTMLVNRDFVTGPVLDGYMQCAAAGDIAYRVWAKQNMPTDDQLRIEYERAREWAIANEDGIAPDDLTILALAGVTRDDELLESDPSALIGPERWLPIRRETEELIRSELWPAVAAIADELSRRTDHIPGADINILAAGSMEAVSRATP